MGFVALTVALLLTALVHWYLYRRLVAGPFGPGSVPRRIGAVVTPLLALLLVVSMAARTNPLGLPDGANRVVSLPGYLWLAVLFYLLVTLGVVGLAARLLGAVLWLRGRLRRRGRPQPDPAASAGSGRESDAPAGSDRGDTRFDPSRRRFLARTTAATAGLVATGAVAVGVPSALGAPDRIRIRFPLAGLPPASSGYRIAMVSDVHLGAYLGRAHAERIVEGLNAFDADAVAIVGDLVDGDVAELRSAVEPFGDIASRDGVYFVTGNHEYYAGVEPWVEAISDLGIRVLRNERVELDGFDLAGVNDLSGARFDDAPDYDRVLDGREAERPLVLLAHQPAQAAEVAGRGVGLQLSGHTHGGQLWPFSLLVSVEQPLLAGLGTVEGTPVYVSRGAGFWGPPVRLGAPQDISLIELVSA